MEEESSRQWEQKEEAFKRYAENRRQVEQYRLAGHRQIAEAFCAIEKCFSCTNRTEAFYCDENDDIGVFFCLDENCQHNDKGGLDNES